MKRQLYLIILCVAVTLSGMAQTIGEAFYIYRNDGQFNAFFREEVDSIAYSHYDADSLYYEENVTQLVYTADSLYRIPLAVIDSVGFVQPETVVNSAVFPLTAEHSPYISYADTLRFTMSSTTPDALRPSVGNIVVATADCEAFPDGIVAKVESVSSTETGYFYECTMASMEDVFDQLIVHTQGVESLGEADEARNFQPRRVSLNSVLWDRNWTKTFEKSGTTTTLSIGDRATVTVTVRKTLTTPFFFQLALENTLTSGIDFSAKSTVGNFTQQQIGNTISAGRITVPYSGGFLWFAPKLSLYGYFQEEGCVELKYGGHLNRTDRVAFTYTEGKWSFSHTPLTNVGTDIAQLSMDGYAEVGLKPQVDFSLNGSKAGFGFSASVGLKENINFVLDMTRLSDGGLYDAMRDSYCRTTIPWSLTAHASIDIFSKYDSDFSDVGAGTFSYTFEPKNEPQWGEDRYIFPLFSDVKGQRQGSSNVNASATVSRTPLLPLKLGFSLLDEDENIVETNYDGRTYQAGSLFNNYSCELSGMESGEKYHVRPSVKLFGLDVLASPSADVEGETSCPDENHPHWIDLGLPSGTKWACCNVGASAPEEYGNYYAWGETSPKSVYNWDTYQYGSSWDNVVNIGSDIAGTGYDAATANWGAPWRMPSLAQCQELCINTTSEWTTQKGVNGQKFTGPNGGTIFFPAVGYRWNSDLLNAGSYGNCWSSTLAESYSSFPWSNSSLSWFLYFGSGGVGIGYDDLGSGLSVRPVR